MSDVSFFGYEILSNKVGEHKPISQTILHLSQASLTGKVKPGEEINVKVAVHPTYLEMKDNPKEFVICRLSEKIPCFHLDLCFGDTDMVFFTIERASSEKDKIPSCSVMVTGYYEVVDDEFDDDEEEGEGEFEMVLGEEEDDEEDPKFLNIEDFFNFKDGKTVKKGKYSLRDQSDKSKKTFNELEKTVPEIEDYDESEDDDFDPSKMEQEDDEEEEEKKNNTEISAPPKEQKKEEIPKDLPPLVEQKEEKKEEKKNDDIDDVFKGIREKKKTPVKKEQQQQQTQKKSTPNQKGKKAPKKTPQGKQQKQKKKTPNSNGKNAAQKRKREESEKPNVHEPPKKKRRRNKKRRNKKNKGATPQPKKN